MLKTDAKANKNRSIPSTVIRFNYRIQKQWDLLGNPPSKTGVFQLGVSSYF
jgi:hypothetical protein